MELVNVGCLWEERVREREEIDYDDCAGLDSCGGKLPRRPTKTAKRQLTTIARSYYDSREKQRKLQENADNKKATRFVKRHRKQREEQLKK